MFCFYSASRGVVGSEYSWVALWRDKEFRLCLHTGIYACKQFWVAFKVLPTYKLLQVITYESLRRTNKGPYAGRGFPKLPQVYGPCYPYFPQGAHVFDIGGSMSLSLLDFGFQRAQLLWVLV